MIGVYNFFYHPLHALTLEPLSCHPLPFDTECSLSHLCTARNASPKESRPTCARYWVFLGRIKKIRISKKVETTYGRMGTGREVQCSIFLILESQHSLFALLHRYQMGLHPDLEKHVSASPMSHWFLFAWSRKASCLSTSTSRARFWARVLRLL